MGYTSPTELRLVLARDLSQLGPGAGTGTAADLSDDQLQDAIDAASAQIDAAAFNRYSVPFTAPYPALIVHVCKAIAAWHANAVNLESADISANDPNQRRFEWAVDMLGKVSTGDIDLPDIGQVTTTSAGMVACPSYDGVMFWPDNFGVRYEDENLWRGLPSGTW